MKPFLRLIRPINCLMASIAVLIGAYLGGITGSLTPILFGMVAAFAVSGGGMVINDYYDRDLDIIYDHDKPIPNGDISLKTALIISFVLFSVGIYLSAWINIYALSIALINSLLLVGYAKDLQKRFLLSNLVVSFLVGSTFVFGGITVSNFMPSILLAAMAFFANTAREIIKDIEDKEADVTKGVKSVPIVLGKESARTISSLFVIVAICMSPLPIILDIFHIRYGILVTFSVAVFLWSIYLIEKKDDVSKIQGLLKLGMLLGLIAFLGGAF